MSASARHPLIHPATSFIPLRPRMAHKQKNLSGNTEVHLRIKKRPERFLRRQKQSRRDPILQDYREDRSRTPLLQVFSFKWYFFPTLATTSKSLLLMCRLLIAFQNSPLRSALKNKRSFISLAWAQKKHRNLTISMLFFGGRGGT